MVLRRPLLRATPAYMPAVSVVQGELPGHAFLADGRTELPLKLRDQHASKKIATPSDLDAWAARCLGSRSAHVSPPAIARGRASDSTAVTWWYHIHAHGSEGSREFYVVTQL